MMVYALALSIAIATPAPSTPPPEPNHITVEAIQSFLRTSGNGWDKARGLASQASVRYEMQATSKLRLANTLHWERVSSTWQGSYPGGTFQTWFHYTDYDDELDVELGRPDYPTGVGIGYFDYTPIHDGPADYNLTGLGIGIDRWPNYYVLRSYYGSVWYYPSMRNGSPNAGTYAILRVDAGINFRFNPMQPLNLRVGFASDSWFARDANAADTGFTGPYVALSYWR